MKNLFNKTWRGDISLWKTFWLFGIVGLILFSQILAVLVGGITGIIALKFDLSGSITDQFGIILGFVLVAIQSAYGLIAVVAVFRSANKYSGDTTWARLAKVTMTVVVTIIIVLNVQGLFEEIKSVANQGPVRLP